MDRDRLHHLLERVRAGELPVAEALAAAGELGVADLDFAKIDYHRHLRCGFPEVIFGAGKTPTQIIGILRDFAARGANALVTRLAPEAAAVVQAELPAAQYLAEAGVLTLLAQPPTPRAGRIGILSAGTSDARVAREATETLRFLGFTPTLIQDVGVAGIHRLLAKQRELRELQVIIVVAGMEGALPSVVAGLVAVPVIAVPTSVGYGASFGGVAALLGMLNSCGSGVTVCNIDNGFGAAAAAARITGLLAPPA